MFPVLLETMSLIKKLRAGVYNSFCDQRVGVIGSTGQHTNIQCAIQDNGAVNERYITFAPSNLWHKVPTVTQLWDNGQHHSPKRGLKRKLSSVSGLKLWSAPHCTVRRLYCTVKQRVLIKRKSRKKIFYRDLIVMVSHYETKCCDTTRQHTGQLIRRLLLIPVRLCPSVPWGEKDGGSHRFFPQ